MIKDLMYKVVDVFTANKGLRKTINGFTMNLPARYINYFPADYEHENFTFLREHVKEGNTILDIGAHIGVFSAAAAQLTGPKGKVYAFEPAPPTSLLLKRTISINHFEGIIEPRNEAVGAGNGRIHFYVSAIKGDNSNSLVSYKKDRDLFAHEVDVVSIDDFIKTHNIKSLAFLKMDVEGAEFDALRGATHILRTMRPACIIAIHPEPVLSKGDTLEEIYDLITDADYDIFYDKKTMSRKTFCANRDMIDLHILPAKR